MTATPPESAPTLAPFGRRLGAFLIDWLVAWGLVNLLFWAWGGFWGPTFLAVLVFGVFEVTFTSTKGWSIGKRALDLEVRTADGRTPSAGAVMLRFLGRIPSAVPLMLGFLWSLWDPQQQTWYDKFAGTHVLHVPGAPEQVRGGDWQQRAAGGPRPAPQQSQWVWDQASQTDPWAAQRQPHGASSPAGGTTWGVGAAGAGGMAGGPPAPDPWTAGPGNSGAPVPEAAPDPEVPAAGVEDLSDAHAAEPPAGPPEALPDDAAEDVERPADEQEATAPLDATGADDVAGALENSESPSIGDEAESPEAVEADRTQPLTQADETQPLAYASQDDTRPLDISETREASGAEGAVAGGEWSLQDQPVTSSAPGQAPPGSQAAAPPPGDTNVEAINRAQMHPDVAGWLAQVAGQVDARLDRVNPTWRDQPQREAARVCAFGLLLGFLGTRYPHMGADLSRVAESHPSFSTLMSGSRLATLEQIAQDPARATAWLGPLVDTGDRDRVRLLFD